ncbi:hypothetical protein NKG94_28685 [Micromonospora sp. M12]
MTSPGGYQDQRVVYQESNVVYPDQPAPYPGQNAPYQYYQDEQAPDASSSSQAPQPGGSYGAASPDTVYYSLSSASEGEDLAPSAREVERQWLAGKKEKVDRLKAAVDNAGGGRERQQQ